MGSSSEGNKTQSLPRGACGLMVGTESKGRVRSGDGSMGPGSKGVRST